MEEIRLLGKEDIEVRVAQTWGNAPGIKVNLLLYKNARVDMKIMDELFTPMGWKRSHKLIGDRLYCQVDVWDEVKKEWISKEDVGVESNTEAEKGQASDSFKRACVNWGIGRELYTAPKISVDLNEREWTKDQNGRIRVYASFEVKSIEYDRKSRTITHLEIQDKTGNVRYVFMNAKATDVTNKPTRKAATRKAEEETKAEYKPLPMETYWKIVEAFAQGRPTKTGGDYRETWIRTTNAGPAEIDKFNKDVDSYVYAQKMNNL